MMHSYTQRYKCAHYARRMTQNLCNTSDHQTYEVHNGITPYYPIMQGQARVEI